MSKRTIGEHFLSNECPVNYNLHIGDKRYRLDDFLSEMPCEECPPKRPYNCPLWSMTLEEFEG